MSVIGSIITSHLGETFQVDKITPTRIQASLSDALEAIEHPSEGRTTRSSCTSRATS